MDWQALLLSLKLASVTTGVLLVIGLPLAWWLACGAGPASSFCRRRPASLARVFVQAMVSLPLVLPPTVMGFYLLVLLGPVTAVGRGITHLLGHPLSFSFAGLVLGSVVYSLPFAVQPLAAGFQAVSQSYLEAATGLGMPQGAVFWHVVLPLSRRSVLAAGVLVFAHTVGEFGVVLMLGGNLPGLTRTLSIALFDQVQDFDYAAANQTAGVLVGLSLVALLLVYGIGAGAGAGMSPTGIRRGAQSEA